MIERSLAPTLSQMAEAIRNLRSFIEGMTFEEYQRDARTRHAVERGVEIISEAARRIPTEVQERHPDLPWSAIKGIGNVLRHGYDEVDDRVIWTVATAHLTPLEATLIQIAHEHGIELPPR